MNISEHISFAEATKSHNAERMGIKNHPNEKQLDNMMLVANKIFEPVRRYFFDKYGKPLAVTSFFRSKELNDRTPGSSSTSQHMTGEAMDIDADIYGGATNSEVFEYIKDNLEFCQLIWEFGDNENPAWVHVSYSEGMNKKEILRAVKDGSKTRYIKI